MIKKIFKNKSNLIACLLIVGFIVSLIPIIYVSFYNHASFDDYGYSTGVHHAIIAGGGVLSIIKAAIQQVVENYYNWQGTFSAVFVFALQPGAFSDNCYFLTTLIMLAALVASTIFLFETIIVKWLNQRKAYMLIISTVVLFVQIQYVPDIAEGFFWFNGSSYYTLFYTFSVVLTALTIRIFLTNDKLARTKLTIISCILAMLIGGGNYTTALYTLCALTLVLLLSISEKKSTAKYLSAIWLFLAIAFLISVMAPGNSVRAASTDQMNPIRAIIMSVFYSLVYIGNWTNLGVIIAICFITPLIYIIAQKCTWTFKYPLFVLTVIFGLYACQLTPSLYAMSSVGSGRQINIYFYSYIFMLIFDTFYLCGWLSTKHPLALSIETIKAISVHHMIAILLIFVVLFSAGCLNHGVKKMTSIACTISIINGTAKEYDLSISANIAILESTNGDSYINNLTDVPSIFKPLGLSEDDNTYWVNKQYAEYFDCDTVNLLSSEEDE